MTPLQIATVVPAIKALHGNRRRPIESLVKPFEDAVVPTFGMPKRILSVVRPIERRLIEIVPAGLVAVGPADRAAFRPAALCR